MRHKLELIYFKMRALAEAPRLLLHYTEIEYDDVMSWDYYGYEWSEVKSKVPFKQLPMLVIDRKHEICQSIAILTFIEKVAGINITDPILNAKANAIMQSAQELFMPLNPTINFAVGDRFIKKREDMMPFLYSRFEDLEKALQLDEQMAKAVEHVVGALESESEDRLEKLVQGIQLAENCFDQWQLTRGSVGRHIQELKEEGALAAKPTGSGNGGFILSLWKD